VINSPPRNVGTVKIAADLPLSGDDAPDGLPVKDAITMAIKQAATVCGDSHRDACVTLQLAAYDDVSKGIHDPSKGAKNVELMASDQHIVGMVGPLYESLARSELPIANDARLAIISPATIDECLTKEPADGHCHGLAAALRPSGGNTFFRVVTTRLAEGPAAADFAFNTRVTRSPWPSRRDFAPTVDRWPAVPSRRTWSMPQGRMSPASRPCAGRPPAPALTLLC